MSTFLHGVETKEQNDGPVPVQTVPSSIIGLIGTAPMGPVNQATLSLNDIQDVTQFGPVDLPGFTIPRALAALRKFQVGTVVVVNVLDPDEHKTAVPSENVTFSATTQQAQLAHGAISGLVLKSNDGETTYTPGTDYKSDPLTGELERLLTGTIPQAEVCKATYNYADPSQIVAADIIGTTDIAGMRSGIQALFTSFARFGFKPKILIAPGYSTQNSVAVELNVMAGKLRAVAPIDAPIGITPQQVIEGRGPAGAINFNTSSNRIIPCYPHLKVYDVGLDANVLAPYSTYLAGLMHYVDATEGFWVSPSNHEILGVVGVERDLYADFTDPNAETNLLNAAGIVTVYNANGTGIRAWGNRTAAFPSVTHPRNFIPARRTADMIYESIEQASLQHVDKNVTGAVITDVVATVNAYINTLKGKGAIPDGRCWYDPAKNPPEQIALGNVVYCYDFGPPIPQERQTYEARMNIEYLRNLVAG